MGRRPKDEIGALTLGEIEALADRMRVASEQIREAMRWVNPSVGADREQRTHAAPPAHPGVPERLPDFSSNEDAPAHLQAQKQARLAWLERMKNGAERARMLGQFGGGDDAEQEEA